MGDDAGFYGGVGVGVLGGGGRHYGCRGSGFGEWKEGKGKGSGVERSVLMSCHGYDDDVRSL